MKKAVISNRIYISVDDKLKKEISKELTYKIPPRIPTDPPEIIKTVTRVRTDLLSIPVGRMDLIPQDYEIVDKRVNKPVEFPEFKFDLRPAQKEVHDDIVDNCIINAWTSWGKTFTGIAIAAKLGQKTLVVVHTTNLRNQWAIEVEKTLGIKPGIIGSGKCEIDSPIVIGNTQSLYRKLDIIRKEFGTIILDEMHHVSSPTFSRIVDSNFAKYKIGLSGTIERKDGKHVVFRDYFGPKVYQPPKENYMTPTIDIVKSDIRFLDGKMPWANKINQLASNEDYVRLITFLAGAYAKKGHKVLVVSDRVKFLKAVAEGLGDIAVCVTGEVDQDERIRLHELVATSPKIKVLCGMQSIYSEGISIDPLSALILATPINNNPLLTQLIGRVIRECEDKIPPKIVDIHLKGNTSRNQASNRMGYYIQQGYQIREL